MLYELLRPLLFRLEPEHAHAVTLRVLDTVHRSGVGVLAFHAVPAQPRRIMGLEFKNPLGLAAGLDKNGAHIDALAALGFGFIEVGTVTPRPQPGNPQPRLFRLEAARAIVNRMGFNNLGVEQLVRNVERAAYRGVLGINIGKNFDTPLERAADDYVYCLRRVFPVASYVAINISSPNTAQLRDLQQASALEALLKRLKEEQVSLESKHRRRVPLALKISPDLSAEDLAQLADVVLRLEIDAVIATNTTLARDGVAGMLLEAGGLSGAPLLARSTALLHDLVAALQGRIPVIAAGGVLSGADARAKVAAGAALVQIYTGLIFRGPALIEEIVRALE